MVILKDIYFWKVFPILCLLLGRYGTVTRDFFIWEVQYPTVDYEIKKYRMVPPSYKLVYKPHYITIVISAINHTEMGVINQLS